MDIFPFIAQRELLEKKSPLNIAVDLVAYPGGLVAPTDVEREDGVGDGMNDMFFEVGYDH